MLGMKERFLLSVAAYGVVTGIASCTGDVPVAERSKDADCVKEDTISNPSNGGGFITVYRDLCSRNQMAAR